MSIRSSILVGAAVLVSGASTAFAADLKGTIPSYSMKDPVYAAPAVSPRWYIRVDGAYAQHDTPVMVENGVDTLINPDLDSTWSVGGGIGMYFTPGIRGDLTYERRFEADAEGTLDHAGNAFSGVRKFGLESDLFMANLYYDFNPGGRINPYIGVGLGAVRHKTTEGTVETCGCTTGTIEEAEKWSAAGALMAGVSANLRSRLHLDMGYRFLYLGHAETGAITSTGTVAGAPVTEISDDPTVEEIHAHEFRFGLRYDIR